MLDTNARRNDTLLKLLSPKVVLIAQEYGHEFGIVSLQSVELSKDYSLLICFLSSEHHTQECAKFFRRFEQELKEVLRDSHILRKLPRIHFKIKEKARGEEVLSILKELEQHYNL